MELKYLLFDQTAVATLVSRSVLQSIEYTQGQRLIEHLCGDGESEILENVYIKYMKDGILFIGKQSTANVKDKGSKVFCVDLTSCSVLSEKDRPADLLTVMQKTFRTVLKIWDHQPLSSSEKINRSKTIIFPFVMPDHRRIVIERSNDVTRLEKRNIVYPLLAYKYTAEDPHGEETVDTDILSKAGKDYADEHYQVQRLFPETDSYNDNTGSLALGTASGGKLEGKDSFVFWNYDIQYANLTESQKYVVDFESLDNPLRIDGAAGTGKTLSMLMRAYRLLRMHREKRIPFRIIFISHSTSTCAQGKAIFSNYPEGIRFMQGEEPQSIRFVTLLDYCKEFSKIGSGSLLEPDAGDSKSYQLQIIGEVLEDAQDKLLINTYRPLLSERIRQVFDNLTDESMQSTCSLLQHEFSIQIKGRTDCTLEKYKDLKPITNGLYCETDHDKEFIFRLFTEYQKILRTYNNFDVDDVILETLSRMDAPVWRRERQDEGYDYIFVDEMQLFNINEQSVFHFLTRDYTKKKIPICFALDYCQAVGDRGDTGQDYVERAFGALERKKYRTVFRNSPQIAAFCASIAASGVLMFQDSFMNPYDIIQNSFTDQEERKSQKEPILYMYQNDNEMIKSLDGHLKGLMKDLQCRRSDIAIISFEPNLIIQEGVDRLSDAVGKNIALLDANTAIDENCYVFASPRAVNGLEFQAVVMLGVDEGRVPQTIGTDDISKHFVRYSAYNLLYLVASRAKYRLILLGSNLNGRSPCLEHSIKSGYLTVAD